MTSKKIKVLIIEDDELTFLSLKNMLEGMGIAVLWASTQQRAHELIANTSIDMVFIDLVLNDELMGFDILKTCNDKGIFSIILSGYDNEEYIRKAYVLGCADYMSKPITKKVLELIFSKYHFFRNKVQIENFFNKRFITEDSEVINNFSSLYHLNLYDLPTMILGETGTGKTLLTQLIHDTFSYKHEKFIHVNCSFLSENDLDEYLVDVLLSEQDKSEIKEPINGTVYFDEVTHLNFISQKKLLKIIDEKKIRCRKRQKDISVHFKMISSTSENIKEMVEKGAFRSDLYFRIQGIRFHLRPLRNNRPDIKKLIHYFLKKDLRRVILREEALNILVNYSWPGNIRELKQVIEIILAQDKGVIGVSQLPENIVHNTGIEVQNSTDFLTEGQKKYIKDHGLKKFVEKIENDIILHTWEKNNKKVRITIGELGISNSVLYRVINNPKYQGQNSERP